MVGIEKKNTEVVQVVGQVARWYVLLYICYECLEIRYNPHTSEVQRVFVIVSRHAQTSRGPTSESTAGTHLGVIPSALHSPQTLSSTLGSRSSFDCGDAFPVSSSPQTSSASTFKLASQRHSWTSALLPPARLNLATVAVELERKLLPSHVVTGANSDWPSSHRSHTRCSAPAAAH
jgi:hypothetical protein